MVEFDRESGWFVVMKLEQKERVKAGVLAVVAGKKSSVSMSLYVCKVRALNEPAKEELQRIHTQKASGLMAKVRDLPLFDFMEN
jgi:hypothetical protein